MWRPCPNRRGLARSPTRRRECLRCRLRRHPRRLGGEQFCRAQGAVHHPGPHEEAPPTVRLGGPRRRRVSNPDPAIPSCCSIITYRLRSRECATRHSGTGQPRRVSTRPEVVPEPCWETARTTPTRALELIPTHLRRTRGGSVRISGCPQAVQRDVPFRDTLSPPVPIHFVRGGSWRKSSNRSGDTTKVAGLHHLAM
jgi:hypothetical protein